MYLKALAGEELTMPIRSKDCPILSCVCDDVAATHQDIGALTLVMDVTIIDWGTIAGQSDPKLALPSSRVKLLEREITIGHSFVDSSSDNGDFKTVIKSTRRKYQLSMLIYRSPQLIWF